MRTFRIALAQINVTVGDLNGNTARILDCIDQARRSQVDLIAFPELAVPGYPPEDLLLKPQFLDENRRCVERVAAASEGIAVVVGFADARDSEVYNAAGLAYGGRLVDVYHKQFLPNYGVFDEDRYFRPGESSQVYVVNGTAVGVNICEDIWYPVGPTVAQRAAGAEVIVNINGSPFHAGKRGFRDKMLATRAADNEVFLAYVNLVGGQDELVFDGASMVFDPLGSSVASASQFEEDLLIVDLDVESVFRSRLREPRPRKEDTSAMVGHGRQELIQVSGWSGEAKRPLGNGAQQGQFYDGPDEVYHALKLGTRDYVRKCGFSKVLIALSGGIDSSLVAAIAVDALGSDNVVGVSMPSRFSSEGSVVDAKLLADNLGIELWTLPIEASFKAMLDTLAPHFEGTDWWREYWWSGLPDTLAPHFEGANWGVAEENIQRGRGKHPVQDPRKPHYGPVQQARLAGAHDRKQERNGNGVRYDLRRHVRRIRCYQGRPEGHVLRPSKVPQLHRARAPDPAVGYRQASECGAEARPARPGQSATLRGAGPDTQGVRRGRPQLRRDNRPGKRPRCRQEDRRPR